MSLRWPRLDQGVRGPRHHVWAGHRIPLRGYRVGAVVTASPKGYVPAGAAVPKPERLQEGRLHADGNAKDLASSIVGVHVCLRSGGRADDHFQTGQDGGRAGRSETGFRPRGRVGHRQRGGRIIAGTLSDRIGRQTTLFACFLLQALCIMLLSSPHRQLAGQPPWCWVSSRVDRANYGANLACSPRSRRTSTACVTSA